MSLISLFCILTIICVVACFLMEFILYLIIYINWKITTKPIYCIYCKHFKDDATCNPLEYTVAGLYYDKPTLKCSLQNKQNDCKLFKIKNFIDFLK